MKKLLTLTIIAIIALIGLSVSVNAAEMTATQFLKDLEDGKMSSDVTLTEQVVINNDMTLDLDGKTLELGAYSIDIENGTLTVKNGKVVADVDAFRVLSKGSAILNIEEDTEVIASDCAVIIKFPGAVLNTAGKLTSTGGGYAAIQGNGSIGQGGITVNITGGTVTSEAEGVYFPNTTELNISGGTIVGTTAVYHKSGKLNISGGTLKATGKKAEYVHSNNGCNATGDALIIEACDYSGGVPEVSITGGTFISQNNKAIGYYQQTEDYKLANEKFIEGGFFTSDVSEFVATKCVINPSFEYEFDTYEVKLNKPYVTNGALTEDGTDKIEIGVVSELQGELEEIFEQEIEKNPTLQEALEAGKSVNIHVQMNNVSEEEIDEKKLEAIKETIEDENIVKFYDITLVIKVDGQEIGTITDISSKLKFKVLIPEELIKDDRTFFMYRYHDGKVERLDGTVDEENYFIFETDGFSIYALAYEDENVSSESGTGIGTAIPQPEEDEKDETPKTGSVDVVLLVSAIVVVVSVLGIAIVKKYTR